MNKVIIKGRLSKEVEMKVIGTNNTSVANFSVAVNRRFVKEGEEKTADFFNITAWGKTAEFCNNYFKKGQEILIEGRIENRSWNDENGKIHYATDIIAEQVEFCGSKKDNEQSTNDNTNVNMNVFNTVSSDDDLPF